MTDDKFWLVVFFVAFYQISVAKSSKGTCYSSTDSEMENPGFCTIRSHCHHGSLVPPAIGKCKDGQQCCVPLPSKRKSRGRHIFGAFVIVLLFFNFFATDQVPFQATFKAGKFIMTTGKTEHHKFGKIVKFG